MSVNEPTKPAWGPKAAILGGFAAFFVPQVIFGLLVWSVDRDLSSLESIAPWPLVALELVLMSLSLLIIYLVVKKRPGGLKPLGLDPKDINWRSHPWLVLRVLGVYILATTAAFALLSLVLPTEVLEAEQETGFELVGRSFIDFLPIIVSLIFIAPIGEEIIFRGFIFRGLRVGLSFWPAAVVSSGLFALVHLQINVGIDVFIVGLATCFLVEKTGSLYSAIALHAIKNTVAFALVFVFV